MLGVLGVTIRLQPSKEVTTTWLEASVGTKKIQASMYKPIRQIISVETTRLQALEVVGTGLLKALLQPQSHTISRRKASKQP